MTVMTLNLLLIFWFSFTQDFGADCLKNRYGLKGTSIHLSFSQKNQSHQQTQVKWRRFNREEALACPDGVAPNYRNRMEYNLSDGSLTIKNLQENDSGKYEALLGFWEEEILAAYTLIVEPAVSEPLIEVSQDDNNTSAGLCRATVNCSADGSWATYDCDQSLCTRTHGSLASINITVTALGSREVQCQANNHVSRNHSEILNIMCLEKQESELRSPPGLVFWIVLTICVGVVLGFLLGLVIVLVKKINSTKIHPQCIVAVIDGTVSEQGPGTKYSTVHKPNTSHTHTANNADKNIEGTIYDTPSRQPKAHRAVSVDVMIENQEQQRPREDNTVKVRATVHQAAEPDSEQINTVYCKLGEI
ncbi:uncharacterized protein si:ch1073-220m6.1 [Myxocyprinus asiaticus]|uniref:uncharacterized protein si:ch1073-220m6.1 n=1 Tax=Myxocyprinus asiaticus TaxID=70543 RepID=UPI002223CD91|nr:uncharacterized protein si:ch1073-220m6.1 [Myxocyprinus asiaticus]XP_051575202.1 uncharacterized protein si:ch1073-220m6.1 [Myxocyprinus asiaticus]